jgi:integrase
MAMAVLRKQLGKQPARVFTYRGQPIQQVGTKAWSDALRRAGIRDFRWHDLRHTFATWHRQVGTPTHELQRLGGWKTGVMVERYGHIAPETLQQGRIRSMRSAATFWLRSKRKRARPVGLTRGFDWLPDLGSNQGPTD